jgi:penicillin amidase
MKTKLGLAALVLLGVGIAVLALTPLGTIVSYRVAPSYPENEDETLALDGLRAPVDVYFDDWGIPHVEAQDAVDLARAVGFVQGRYRFFQLDVLRRFGTGRISELIGEQKILFSTTVEFDLAMRGWGFAQRAHIDLGSIPEFDRDVILAFTDGVNQALGRYRPVEYDILGIEPEPWELSDCLMVAMVQSWSITHNWEQEAVRLSLALNLGLAMSEAIYPNEPLPGEPTIAASGGRGQLPAAIAPEITGLFPAAPDAAAAASARARYALGSLAQIRPSASNAWVVASARSASGMPILSNDMHLSHTLPSLLFLQHIKTPELDAIGVTLPGLPFLVAGHNGSVAWGATSAVADVVDLVIERRDPRRPEHVESETGDCPLERRVAVVRVRDGEAFDERRFSLRRTCHGPLLNDMYPGYLPEDGPLVAIHWESPGVERSFGHLYRANRARNVDELREHLMRIPSPVQNIVAADRDGHIAFFSTGSVPIRRHHRGTFAAPGWLEKYAWAGWTPADEMPHLRDPGRGYLVNTNNKAVSPHHHRPLFQVDSAPSYRADRVVERLEVQSGHTRETVQAIQLDTKAPRAAVVLPGILDDLDELEGRGELSTFEIAALDALRGWNHDAAAESTGALIFYATYREAIVRALDDKLSDPVMHLFLVQRYSTNAVDLWFEADDHVVWDEIGTPEREGRADVVGEAFQNAVASFRDSLGGDLAAWSWGDVHVHRPKHLFGGQSVLDFMNLRPVGLGGGLDSVWKAHFNLGNDGDPFCVVAGPAYRFAADLADLDDAQFGIDTGESGWALSPHYGDLYEKWVAGELVPAIYDWGRIRETSKAHHRLVTSPAGG